GALRSQPASKRPTAMNRLFAARLARVDLRLIPVDPLQPVEAKFDLLPSRTVRKVASKHFQSLPVVLPVFGNDLLAFSLASGEAALQPVLVFGSIPRREAV